MNSELSFYRSELMVIQFTAYGGKNEILTSKPNLTFLTKVADVLMAKDKAYEDKVQVERMLLEKIAKLEADNDKLLHDLAAASRSSKMNNDLNSTNKGTDT